MGTKRVGAAGVEGRPTVEIEGGVVGGVTDEVADRQLDRAAFIDVRLHVDQVAAAGRRDGVQRHGRIGTAAAGQDERAALQGHRIRRLETGRGRDAHRVEAVVIPIDRAVIDFQARRAGQRAGIAEMQGAAADDGLAGVGVRVGQQRGAVAGTGEGEVAAEDAAEAAAARGREERGGHGTVRDRAAHAGQDVGRTQDGDRLAVTLQVDRRAGGVDEERRKSGRTGEAGRGEGVIRARVEIERAAVDVDRGRGGNDGGRGTGRDDTFAAGDLELGRAQDRRDEAVGGDTRAGDQAADREAGRRIDRDDVAFEGGVAAGQVERGHVGAAVEVQDTVVGLHETGRTADAVGGVEIERGAVEDVEIGRAFGGDRAGVQRGDRAGAHQDARSVIETDRQQAAARTIGAEGRRIERRGQRGRPGARERVHLQVARIGQGAGQAGVLALAERGVVRVEFRRGIEGAEVISVGILHQEAGAVARERGVDEDVAADLHVGGAVGAVARTALIRHGEDRQRGAARNRILTVDARDDERAGVVGRGQAAEREGDRATADRSEFDPTAAGLHLEELDGFNRVGARVAREAELTALEGEEAGIGQAETVGEVGGGVIQEQRAAVAHHEVRSGAGIGDEGLTGVRVAQRAAEDGEGAVGAIGGLGRSERERTGTDLGEIEDHRVVEALEATREARAGVVVTDVKRRDHLRGLTRERGVEDVARAGEGAPGGGEIGEVVAGAAGDRERRVARTGVEDAVTQAARGDREGAREAGLRAHLEDAVAALGDAAGGTDDGLEREPGEERRDVCQTSARDRIDRHRARGSAEVDAAFDRGDRADVLGGGHDAARADREHAGAAEAGRMVVIEGTDGGIGRTAVVVEDEALERVVTEQIEVRITVERDDVRRGDLAGDGVRRRSHVHGGPVKDQPVGRDRGGRDDRTGRRGEKVDRAAVDHRTAGVGGRGVGQVVSAAGGGDHEADRLVGADAVIDDARVQRHRVLAIEQIEVAGGGGRGAAGGQAATVDGRADRVVVVRADEAAADEVEDVRRVREVQALGDAREAQGVDDRGARGDRRAPGQTHVAGGSAAARQIGRRIAGAVVAQHHEARADDIGQEVGVIDRPAADDAVGESGAAFEGRGLGADIADARAAERGVGLQDEGRRGTRGTGERGHQQVLGIHRSVGAVVHVDDVEAGVERHGADRLGGGDVRAAVKVQGAGAEAHGRTVAEAVRDILRAGGVRRGGTAVVELQRRVRELEGVDARQGGLGNQVRRAAVEQGLARERQRAVQREGVLARADEGRGTLDLAGPSARAVVLIHDEGATGRASDDAVDVRDGTVAEEGESVLDLAVEVEGAAGQREVVVRLDGVVREELHRAVIDHELTAEGIGALGGQAVDRGERRLEGKHAGAGLDRADVAVGDAVAAVEGSDEIEVADRPEVEGREVAGLVEDATGEKRRAGAVTDEDTAALERKPHAGGQGQASAGLDGQRVGRDGGRDRDLRGEVEIVVRRDGVIRVVLVRETGTGGEGAVIVDLLIERARVGRATVGGTEGSAEAGLRVVDQHPGHDALVLGIITAALAVPGDDAVPPEDGVAQAGAEVRATDEQAGARRARALRLRDVVRDGAGELQARGVGVHRPEGDHRRATIERAAAEIFRRVVGRGAADDGEVTSTEGDVVARAILEDAVSVDVGGREAAEGRALAGRVVDQQRGALVEEERRAPGGVARQIHRALAEDERAAGDAGVDQDILRVGDDERARAVLLDGIVLVVRRAAGSGDLRPRQGDVACAREVELAFGGVLLDAAGDRQVAGGRTDGGIDGHADGADIGIVTGDVLDDAAEIKASEQLVVRGARGDGIVDLDAAAELQRRADRGGAKRDDVAARAGRGGVAEVDRAVVDREAAGEVIGAAEGQDGRAFLGQTGDAADLLDRTGDRDRVGKIERHGGVQEDRPGQGAAGRGTAHRSAAGNARAGDPNGVRNGALDVERRGVGRHHQRLGGRGAERIDAAEREGAGGEGDVPGEARVGVGEGDRAGRRAGDTEITAAGELADIVELDDGRSAKVERAAARTDGELLRVEVRIEDTRAQLELAAIEDDLAGRAGGAERAGRGIGAVVSVARHRERAAIDEDVARKTVGARHHQGALPCLGEAARRGGSDRSADVQRVARGVDADEEVLAGGRGQAGRTGDGRSRVLGSQHGRRIDQTVRDERGAPRELKSVDGDAGRLGDRAGRAARRIDPIRPGRRERGGSGHRGGERGVGTPIDGPKEETRIVDREVRRGDGRGRVGRTDEIIRPERTRRPRRGRERNLVRGAVGSALDDEEGVRAIRAAAERAEIERGVAAAGIRGLDDAAAGREAERTEILRRRRGRGVELEHPSATEAQVLVTREGRTGGDHDGSARDADRARTGKDAGAAGTQRERAGAVLGERAAGGGGIAARDREVTRAADRQGLRGARQAGEGRRVRGRVDEAVVGADRRGAGEGRGAEGHAARAGDDIVADGGIQREGAEGKRAERVADAGAVADTVRHDRGTGADGRVAVEADRAVVGELQAAAGEIERTQAQGARGDAGADRAGVDRERAGEGIVVGKGQLTRAGLGEVRARAAGEQAREGDVGVDGDDAGHGRAEADRSREGKDAVVDGMTEGDVAAEGDRIRELVIADTRAGEVIARDDRRVVQHERPRAEGGVVADADAARADRDAAAVAAGGGERQGAGTALRDATGGGQQRAGEGDVRVDDQGADGRTEVHRAGEGQRTGLHGVAEDGTGAEGDVVRQDVGGRRRGRQRRRTRQHEDLRSRGAERELMADLHDALGKRRTAHVAVIARDDEGVGGVLGEARRQAVHRRRDRARDADDLGDVDRAAGERGEFAALHGDRAGVILVAALSGLDDRRTEVEHAAVDRDRTRTEGGVPFRHTQGASVDRRAAGVGAFTFEQPGAGAVLDHGGLRRAAVVRDDLREVVAVGVRAGQRQRARRRAEERKGSESLEQERRARGAGSVDRRAARVDLEKSVGEIIDATRTFETQRADGRRATDEQVVAGVAGVRSAEAATGKAVLDVGDRQRAVQDLDRTGESIGAGELPDAGTVLDQAGVADEIIGVAVVRDDRCEEIGVGDRAARAGEGQRADVGIGAGGQAERAGVREADRLGGVDRRRSIDRQTAGRACQGAEGEQTVGRIIRTEDAVADPLERGVGAQGQVGRVAGGRADRARDAGIGELGDLQGAGGPRQRARESVGRIEQLDAARAAFEHQAGRTGDDAVDDQGVGRGAIGPRLAGAEHQADIGPERRDAGGGFQGDTSRTKRDRLRRSRVERESGGTKNQPIQGGIRRERHGRARACEISLIRAGKGVGRRSVRSARGSGAAGIVPISRRRIPATGAAEVRDGTVGIPENVRGAGLGRRAGDHHRGSHQRGAAEGRNKLGGNHEKSG